ncbi:MAG: tetratricopeptide repeat protein, partial [Acidobacteriota bacterium]
PARSGGEELTATDLLLYGADRAEADLVEQPKAQAAVLAAIGDALVRQDLHDRAAPLIESALATSRRLADAPAVHRLMTIQCQIARRNKDFDKAKALATELVALVQAAEVEDPAAQANAFFELGRAQYALLENDAAEQSFRRSLAFQRIRNPPRPDSLVRALGSLAGVLRRQGKIELAEEAAREELTVVQRIHTDDNPLVASALHRLALILVDLDQLEEAQALLEEAAAMKRRLYGDDSLSLASSVNNLGHLALLRGDLELAEGHFLEALELRRRRSGEGGLGQVSMLANLGRVAQLKGQYGVGESFLRQAIGIRSSHLGPTSSGTLQYQTYLAGLLVAKGQIAAASGLVLEILTQLESTGDSGSRPWFAALAEAVQVACEIERARLKGAEARLSAALDELRMSRGPRSFEVRQVEGYLERLGQRQGTSVQGSGG